MSHLVVETSSNPARASGSVRCGITGAAGFFGWESSREVSAESVRFRRKRGQNGRKGHSPRIRRYHVTPSKSDICLVYLNHTIPVKRTKRYGTTIIPGSDDHAKTDNGDIPREGAACIMHAPVEGSDGASEGAGGHALKLAIRCADHARTPPQRASESICDFP